MRIILLLLSALAATPALATTAVRAPLPELVTEADLVVLGTAGQPMSEWRGSRIITRTPVTVEEIWAGEIVATTIEVITLGGVVDGIGQKVSGALRLRSGQRVVLCLQRRSGALRVVEMGQGAFFVSPEPVADPTVRRRSFGMRLLGTAAPAPATLRSLEAAVREADHARR